MLSFVRELSEQLYFRAIDIEKSIKSRSSSVFSIMQSYLEKLCKILVEKEKENLERKNINIKLIKKPSIFFNDEVVCHYFSNLLQLENISYFSNIIASGNTYKHDMVFQYKEDIVKEYYIMIYDISASTYRKYINNKQIDNFDKNQYDNLSKDNKKELVDKIDNLNEQYNLDRVQYEEVIDELNKKLAELVEKRDQLIEENKEVEDLYNLAIKQDEEIENLKFKISELSKDDSSFSNKIESLTSELKLYKDKLCRLEESIKIDSTELENDYTKYNKLNAYFYCGGYNYANFFVCYNIIPMVNCGSKYKSFYAVINNLLQRGTSIKPSLYLQKYNLQADELSIVYKFQILILLLIKNNILNDKVWNINLISGDIKLLKIAILDILRRVKTLCKLADQTYNIPIINLLNDPYLDFFVNISDSTSANYNVYSVCDYFSKFDDYTDYIKFIDSIQNRTTNFWFEEKIIYKVSGKEEVLSSLFYELFSYPKFRSGQFEILKKVFSGVNTIGILPTGAGKSVIFQFYALLEPSPTIIISPLISLIRDQIRNLNNKFNITRVNFVGDGRKADDNILESLMIYISPERLQIDTFRRFLRYVINNKHISTIVFDEVHCLSDWGHDFRISYLMSKHVLNRYFSGLQYIGLTATASINVLKDLISELDIRKSNVVAPTNLKRLNLNYKILDFNSEGEMKEFLLSNLKSIHRKQTKDNIIPQVVFMKTRGECDSFAEELLSLDNSIVTQAYYSDAPNKNRVFDSFISNQTEILFATKAFGMGVDKPNIRFSYHFGIPSSMENFFQESGRAGRDNENSTCFMLSYKSDDFVEQKVKKILDLDTKPNEFQQIRRDLRHNSDLSTNLFFLSQSIEDPKEEADSIYQLYNDLKDTHDDNDMCILTFNNINKTKQEQQLYKLFCIGVVKDWTINYRNSTYSISLEDFDINVNYFKKTLIKYLKVREEIDLNDKLSKVLQNASTIYHLILILCYWSYENFVKYRREQLRNIYQFKSKHANKNSENIQDELLSFFNLSSFLSDNSDDDITFVNKEVDYIFKKVLDKEEVDESLFLEYDHLMESNVSYKTELFVSLINIKFNRLEDINGASRFLNALSRMTDKVKMTFVDAVILNYHIIDNEFKVALLQLIFKHSLDLFYYFLKELNYFDELTTYFALKLLNTILE